MYALVYDTGCGPCTTFKDAVALLDAGRRMRYVGLRDADRLGFLDPVDPARRHRSFHLVSPEGEVWSGADALPRLLALLPGGRPVSWAISNSPPLSSATRFVYAVFSRLHDSGACGYPGVAFRQGRVSANVLNMSA